MGEAIMTFRGKYDFLSNMYAVSFEWDGRPYKNSEAAFQSAKTLDPALYEKPLPVLIAHGRADDFVPYRMSEENMKAFTKADGSVAPNAEFFTSETAEHGMSFLRDYDGYMAALARLFDKAGLPHEKVEVEEFVPETPVEELTRPEMHAGTIFTVK